MSNANIKRAPEMTDVAAALGCKTDGAKSRLVALGYVKVCSRCGGSGHYSYNQIDGTKCFGCSGSGKQMVKLTWAIVAEAKARQEAGELDAYFTRNRARAAAKKEIEPLAAEAEAIYSTIGDAYTRAGKVPGAQSGYINESLFLAQGLNNDLYWGPDKAGKCGSEMFASDAVRDVEYRVKHGEIEAERAVAILRERIADLAALRDAAAPHLETWIANPRPRAA